LNVRCQWFGASQNIKNFCGEEDYLLLEPKNAESDQTTDFGANWLIKDSAYCVKSKEEKW
jgi:hypothetical protein